MASMDLRTEHRQTQTLSPRLQHAVRLLQMSSLDFAAMVRDKLGQNPFLETEEGDDGEALPGADDAAERESDRDSEPQELDGIAGNEAGDDRDMWQGDTAGSTRRAEDGEISAMEMMAVETTLNMHLHEQLGVLPLAHRDLMLARAIVESLDDDGYLRTPLEEVAQVLQLDPPPTLVELTIALKRVQSLDPAGVAARSVAECLQLQLGKIDCPQMRALAERIVGQHLQTLAAKDVNGLAHQLGETPARVEAVCDRIRRLDPRPGWHFGSTQVAYVVPDVLVRRVRGQWNVQLNPAVVPKVRFNQVYAELFQRHRSAQNTEMAGHLQDARWTLRNVEQRFSTILDVATAIVRRQRHFLEYGPMAMKPLVLREIADEVGIHESTVSRVTNNKYMATPIGVFELKYFFSRAMISANGSACSATAIRGLIKDIIEAERSESPLSDAEITRQLARQGLVVARRTVTKYRQMLKIESVERRRRHS
ncbi:RNA polymerase factor sigma-54 [Rubrivivax gelatinosus]|uniref:RNA polymerase sigma-54 factor n=1 Tax=Rubrivivax gelatinosus TaxID=28068 RepID=A0ABS1DQU8_RUBGE|nr:RNA polymerase factor sigma-54 [Rubrivivax gelatinosus]MBK1711330.1 RNA polymerase sigma-54 factor [Rubrivivax gelatinosus]